MIQFYTTFIGVNYQLDISKQTAVDGDDAIFYQRVLYVLETMYSIEWVKYKRVTFVMYTIGCVR